MNAENEIRKVTGAIEMEWNTAVMELQMNFFRKMVKNEIRAFYSSYAPIEYRRRYSLYQMIQPGEKNGNFIIRIGGDLASVQHRVSNEYIYQNSFKQGYHGGATHNGGKYWRTPRPNYPYWGREATKTDPPYDNLKEEWFSFVNGKGKQFCQNLYKQLLSKYSGLLADAIDAYTMELLSKEGGR